MSMSSKKFCFPEDVEKRNSTINEEDEMQEYEKKILQCVLTQKITPIDLKNWLPFHLLKPEFISQIHKVLVHNDDHAIIVMKNKNVYNLNYKHLDYLHAIYPQKIKELCGKNIKTFAYGVCFFLALTEEGEVYYWELIKFNWDSENPHVPITPPTRVAGLSKKRVVDIACGYRHCLALTSDGKVYAWGENKYGQVGNENTAIFINVPEQVKHELENKNVVHIACGATFNIVLTDENKLYGWGNKDKDQTVQTQKYHVYPHEITNIPNKIVKVTCGYYHTLVLTNKGEIYAWGNNSRDQLGVNTWPIYWTYNLSDPIMVNVPEMGKVLDIAAFGDSSFAVGYDGTIYVWGKFLYQEYICIYPLPTKFSRIHDLFAYNTNLKMYKLLTEFTNNYKYVEEILNILESVGTAFNDPLTSDFTIQVEGRSIYVHKAILQIRCEYFKKMFQHDWAENIQSTSDSSSVFTVSDEFSYIVYKAFLKYLYTGTIDLPSENALELMELADMYCETNLIKDCSQIIKKAITVSNVSFFYNKAIEYNAKELEEFCFQFALCRMTADTLLEDIELDINMQAKFIHKAATQSRDTIMSMSKKFCSPKDVEKRNSTINKEDKMQKYDKRILQCVLAEKIISMYLKNWPFFWMLEPEFILQIHMVMIFGYQGGRTIIVTKHKNVYDLNYYSWTDDKRVIYPKKIKELCGKNIKTFAAGDVFILALTEEGEVYSSVFEEDTDTIPDELTITQVAGLSKKYVVDIACGEDHSLALTSDGKVYAWGKNYCGQVGNENREIFISAPWQVKHELENKIVVHIACGSNFNMVLTNENKIYGWGNNYSGQISTDQSQELYVYPHETTTISDKIVNISCGREHTLVLTNKGEIYAWGNNHYGQIGINKDCGELARSGPIMVNVPEMGKVLDIAASVYLSVAVGYDRIIYIWGCFHGYIYSFFGIKKPFPTKFSTIQEVFAYSRSENTHKPLTVFMNVEEVSNILESVGAAFDNPLTSDFTIQVERRPIYVHKAILNIRCEYFKKMFQSDWAENIQSTSNSSVFPISDEFSYIVYKAFLKYLYTGTIDLPSENALELMELADMYCETNLIKDCSQIIKKAITVSNVSFFYNKAIECNAKELEEFCFQFALRHMTDVILSEDFIKLDINTKDNFMRRAAKENAFRI